MAAQRHIFLVCLQIQRINALVYGDGFAGKGGLRPLALPGEHARQGRDGGGNHQNDEHGVLQLGDKALQQSGLFGFLQLVSAVFGKPLFGFGSGKSPGTGTETVKNLPGGKNIRFHHDNNLPAVTSEFLYASFSKKQGNIPNMKRFFAAPETANRPSGRSCAGAGQGV